MYLLPWLILSLTAYQSNCLSISKITWRPFDSLRNQNGFYSNRVEYNGDKNQDQVVGKRSDNGGNQLMAAIPKFGPSPSLSYRIFGYNLYEPMDQDIDDPSNELRDEPIVETSEVLKYFNDHQIEYVYQPYDPKSRHEQDSTGHDSVTTEMINNKIYDVQDKLFNNGMAQREIVNLSMDNIKPMIEHNLPNGDLIVGNNLQPKYSLPIH